jgi:hypothetical protein
MYYNTTALTNTGMPIFDLFSAKGWLFYVSIAHIVIIICSILPSMLEPSYNIPNFVCL